MRQLRMWPLFVVSLTCLLAVAQDNAPAVSKPADIQSAKATVYIYRYKQFVGSALEPSVYCDDVQLARMDNGRYFTVKVEAGKHTFRSNDQQSGIVLDMKAGETSFIRVEIATGFMKGHGRLILTPREQASYELASKKLKPLDDSKVMDKTRVSTEVAQLQPQAGAPKATAPAEKSPEPGPAVQAPTPTQATPKAETQTSEEHSVPGTTLIDAPSTVSQSGEQISLGEAARRAREKKQAAR